MGGHKYYNLKMKQIKLLQTLRPSNAINLQSSQLAVRGPKKKKGGKGEADAPLSNDIVNIFKDREDPKIYATDKYPSYLMQYIGPQYRPEDVMLQLYRGERIPTASEQWSLAKSMKRTFVTDGNKLIKRDWVYESDDDFGEDLGQDVEEEDYDEDMDDEDGEKKPLTEEEKLMKEAGL